VDKALFQGTILPNTYSAKPFSPNLPFTFKHPVADGSNDAGNRAGSSDSSDQGQGLAYGNDAFAPFGAWWSADTLAGTLADLAPANAALEPSAVDPETAAVPIGDTVPAPRLGSLPDKNSMPAVVAPIQCADTVTAELATPTQHVTIVDTGIPVVPVLAPPKSVAGVGGTLKFDAAGGDALYSLAGFVSDTLPPGATSSGISFVEPGNVFSELSDGNSTQSLKGPGVVDTLSNEIDRLFHTMPVKSDALVGSNAGLNPRLSEGAPAVGGLVGYARGSIDNVSITASVASASVTYNPGLLTQYVAGSFAEGQSRFVGGLVGSNQGTIVSMDAGSFYSAPAIFAYTPPVQLMTGVALSIAGPH